MTDPRDVIARILESAERAAFERGRKCGWQEALDSFGGTIARMKHKNPPNVALGADGRVPRPRRPGRPSSNAIEVVEQCIIATPGMKGVDVVKAAQSVDAAMKERTVRTCLRRLRLNNAIGKQDGLWYPRAKDKTSADNGPAAAARQPARS